MSDASSAQQALAHCQMGAVAHRPNARRFLEMYDPAGDLAAYTQRLQMLDELLAPSPFYPVEPDFTVGGLKDSRVLFVPVVRNATIPSDEAFIKKLIAGESDSSATSAEGEGSTVTSKETETSGGQSCG